MSQTGREGQALLWESEADCWGREGVSGEGRRTLPSKEGEEGQGVGLARRRMPSSEWQWRAMADERRKRLFPLSGVGSTVCRAGRSFQRWSLKARAGERGRGRMRVYNQRFASERLRLQLNARCTDLRKHQETIPVTWGCKETPRKEPYAEKNEEPCTIHTSVFTIQPRHQKSPHTTSVHSSFVAVLASDLLTSP